MALDETRERGLALYIAERIAYVHEAELAPQGIDGELRGFHLTLPVQLKGRGRGRILVVDDNPQAATLLEYALQQEGFEAIKALNGLEGLKLARSERVDLVILDILLPGIDGFEVCHRLRSGNCHNPGDHDFGQVSGRRSGDRAADRGRRLFREAARDGGTDGGH
jgi:hypothetical protein